MREEIYTKFLEAFGASLKQENVSWTNMTTAEWNALFRLANKQQVLPLIYQAVYDCPAAKKEPELLAKCDERVCRAVYRQTKKTARFLELYQKLCDAGVKPLVIKGLICRSLYPQPSHRPSTDEDILIPADQFETAHRVMMGEDLELLEPEQDIYKAYEVAYVKKGLYVELHKQLFPEESEVYGYFNRYFEGVHERAITETVQGVAVHTMGHTDHLFYLICHAFKHFIYSGCGVRQICDIVLYANAHGAQIDWKQIRTRCREIKADKWMAALLEIGEKYFGFDYEKACCPKEWVIPELDTKLLLKDMLEGGILGNAERSRLQSSTITANAVIAANKGKKAKASIVKTIFPPVTYMSGRYSYLEKHPYLLPVAWTSRIVEYGKSTKSRKGGNPSRSIRIGNERVALLKEYGIIKEEVSEKDMDNQMRNFMEIIRYAIHNDSGDALPNLLEPVDWEKLENISREHNLFAIFHEVASKFPEYRKSPRYQENACFMLIMVGQQIKRTEEFLQLYQDFLKEDLHPIVMKGIICRQLYGKCAEQRPSGDEDIYVRKDEFFKVKAVLEARGYVCEFEEVTEGQLNQIQHITFSDAKNGYTIEVHANPMGHRNEMRSQMNDYFDDAFARMRVEMIREVPVYTFSHTEHFLFLIMHSVKHFVEGGVGIRQMLDVLLYQAAYEDEIDWEVMRGALADTHTEGFLGDMQHIGKEYLGFDFKVCFKEICPEVLLKDMLAAGVFGKKERDDTVATSITMEVLNHKSRGLYAWFRAGFPSKKLMVDAYPYLEEKPWMLPIEWVKRWGRFLRKAGKHDGNLMMDGLRKSRKRIKMLSKYGL